MIILDRKSVDGAKKTREFIDRLIEENCLVGELNSYTKSYIFVNANNKTMIYTSKISSKTLLNRGSYKELFRMEAIKWSK